MNPYDGTAAQLVPLPVERLPLYHWRPGTRLLVIGSRAGPSFTVDLERDEATTFRRVVAPATVREAVGKLGCAGVAATWSETLLFPQALAALRAAEPAALVIATSGPGDPRAIEALLPVVDAWLLLCAGVPTLGARLIASQGRHVEVLLGLDSEQAPPALPWANVSAIHLVPRHLSAAPEARRGWYAAARRHLPSSMAVYDEDQSHSDCTCGARLLWRSGGVVRRDALADDGSCTACGHAKALVGA